MVQVAAAGSQKLGRDFNRLWRWGRFRSVIDSLQDVGDFSLLSGLFGDFRLSFVTHQLLGY